MRPTRAVGTRGEAEEIDVAAIDRYRTVRTCKRLNGACPHRYAAAGSLGGSHSLERQLSSVVAHPPAKPRPFNPALFGHDPAAPTGPMAGRPPVSNT